MTGMEFIDGLASRGRYTFTTDEARKALGGSAVAARAVLRRLAAKGETAAPVRGFHVIVPPEYRRLGCLPADQFVPQLMTMLGEPYYVGLLSAAQYHGAAHHRPQELQVLVGKARRPIVCGAVRVRFVMRSDVRRVPTTTTNTPRGPLRISTPEATALDLVGYPQHAGGLDVVAAVLGELREALDARALVKAAATAPVPWAQRLGYLLELDGTTDLTEPLAAHVNRVANEYAPLAPGSRRRGTRITRWRLRREPLRIEAPVDALDHPRVGLPIALAIVRGSRPPRGATCRTSGAGRSARSEPSARARKPDVCTSRSARSSRRGRSRRPASSGGA